MANSFGNPIILDSTMAATWQNTANNNAPANQDINVQKIIWDGMTTTADSFTLQYGDGTTFLQGTITGAQFSPVNYDFFGGRKLKDFKLSALVHGKIYIYYN